MSRACNAPYWLILLTISLAALSTSTTPSASATSPQSTVSLRTKSMSFHCGRCCSLGSCVTFVRSRLDERMPLRQRKAGMTRVPSGVSKKVLGSRSVSPALSTIWSMKPSFLRLNSCSSFALFHDTVSSLVLRGVLKE